MNKPWKSPRHLSHWDHLEESSFLSPQLGTEAGSSIQILSGKQFEKTKNSTSLGHAANLSFLVEMWKFGYNRLNKMSI